MNHDRMDADRLEQHDILREALPQVRRFHRMAAVLDDKSFAAEALNIGQRFDQYGCARDWVLHLALRWEAGVSRRASGSVLTPQTRPPLHPSPRRPFPESS